VDVEQISLRMNPESFAFRGRRNLVDLGRGEELVRLHARDQLADVQVNMTLGLDARRVVGDGPLVAEQRFGFFDRGGQQIRARSFAQQIDRSFVGAGKRERPIGLGWIRVFQKKEFDAGRLLFRLAAESALPRFQSFRTRYIASASNDVAAQTECEQKGGKQAMHHFDYKAHYTEELLSDTVWKRRTILLAAAVALFFLYLFGLTRTGLIGPDEPRYAAIGQAMARTGDWITPRLWGNAWFEKPPLLYWMTAAGFKAGLGEDLAPRLPVAILSATFLIWFFLELRRAFDERTAFFATTILATSAGWLAFSHVAVTDLPLAATFGVAMLIAYRTASVKDSVVAGIFLGLAILAKGLVPIVLFAPAVWFLRHRLRELLVIFGVAAIAASPWYVAVTRINGSAFLQEFFWKHHFERFLTGALLHERPFWFYVPVVLAALFPWSPFLCLLFSKSTYKDPRARFLAAWFGWGLLFFSLSRNKLPGYLLPLLPPLAALLGVAIQKAQPRAVKMAALVAAAGVLLGFVPAIQDVLPQALRHGFSRAQFHPQLWWLLPALLLGSFCIFLDRTGRRPQALSLIALGVALSVVRLVWQTYPQLDREVSPRSFWIEHSRTISCSSERDRAWRYGLNYYAGRNIPDCH